MPKLDAARAAAVSLFMLTIGSSAVAQDKPATPAPAQQQQAATPQVPMAPAPTSADCSLTAFDQAWARDAFATEQAPDASTQAGADFAIYVSRYEAVGTTPFDKNPVYSEESQSVVPLTGVGRGIRAEVRRIEGSDTLSVVTGFAYATRMQGNEALEVTVRAVELAGVERQQKPDGTSVIRPLCRATVATGLVPVNWKTKYLTRQERFAQSAMPYAVAPDKRERVDIVVAANLLKKPN